MVLARSFGLAACLLGKTWGYDDTGVWVGDGCSGEFQLGASACAGRARRLPRGRPSSRAPTEPTKLLIEAWGEFEPGDGFLVGRNSKGELAISAYALLRYVNQMPGSRPSPITSGNTRKVDGRNDIWPHRIMVFLKGWLGDAKLIYSITFWTVKDTDQDAIFGNLGYQFSRKFSAIRRPQREPRHALAAGSHPFWLGNDRVMADEFFRPFFTSGVWAQGEAVPGLWYNAMLGDNNSSSTSNRAQLDRTFTTGASVWWMPTTKEFGPKGAYGDWECHDKLATRFGFSTTRSPEQRFTNGSALPTTQPSGWPTA